MVKYLKNDGFMEFHNGTIAEFPSNILVTDSGFTGVKGGSADHNNPWINEYLALGMYVAPSSSPEKCAFVVTNPWVEDGVPPVFGITATIDPAVYGIEDDDGNGGYHVTMIDDSGTQTVYAYPYPQTFTINDQQIPAGEIWRWEVTD